MESNHPIPRLFKVITPKDRRGPGLSPESRADVIVNGKFLSDRLNLFPDYHTVSSLSIENLFLLGLTP